MSQIKLNSGQRLRSATCLKCGAKVYPATTLKDHTKRHEIIYGKITDYGNRTWSHERWKHGGR